MIQWLKVFWGLFRQYNGIRGYLDTQRWCITPEIMTKLLRIIHIPRYEQCYEGNSFCLPEQRCIKTLVIGLVGCKQKYFLLHPLLSCNISYLCNTHFLLQSTCNTERKLFLHETPYSRLWIIKGNWVVISRERGTVKVFYLFACLFVCFYDKHQKQTAVYFLFFDFSRKRQQHSPKQFTWKNSIIVRSNTFGILYSEVNSPSQAWKMYKMNLSFEKSVRLLTKKKKKRKITWSCMASIP